MRPYTLILSPKFFPIEDGLGRYTYEFFEALKRELPEGSVQVLTSNNDQIFEATKSWEGIFPIVGKWKFWHLRQCFKTLSKKSKPERVLVQYVPTMYGPWGGINFSFIFFLWYLRWIQRVKLQVMYHELHYPLLGDLKSLVIFSAHILMLVGSGGAANQLYGSTAYNTRFLKKLFFGLKRKVFHLPVGSNVTVSPISEAEKNERRKKIAPHGEMILGCFGTFHPSKNYPLIIQTLSDFLASGGAALKLVFVGATTEDILKNLPTMLQASAKKFVVGTGFLSIEEVSHTLQIMDGFVAYFIDGATTRRASMLAALQHGVPVLSTTEARGDELFKGLNFMTLLHHEPKLFSIQMTHALKQGWPLKQKKQGVEPIVQFYDAHFSWDILAKSYISYG